MFRNKKDKDQKKKRSWELDEEEDDGTPSDTFLKLQEELKERERLSKEKELEIEKLRKEAEDNVKDDGNEATDQNSLASKPCDDQSAQLTQSKGLDPKITICVTGYHNKTRIHELKQHFHQFGDLVEIVMRGNQAFLTFDREKDASDAVMDGSAAPLSGRRLSVSFSNPSQLPANGFHGGYRWHRDDALRKKEGMRQQQEVRQQQVEERRAWEKEQRKRDKEREKRREEERERRERERSERDKARSDKYSSSAHDTSGDRDSNRPSYRRDRSRSRDRTDRSRSRDDEKSGGNHRSYNRSSERTSDSPYRRDRSRSRENGRR